MNALKANKKHFEAWLVDYLMQTLSLEPDELKPNEPFQSYGMDSLTAVAIVSDIEDFLCVEDLPGNLIAEHNTIQKLSDYIYEI